MLKWISETNILVGIYSLDEAEDWINDLEHELENTPIQNNKKKEDLERIKIVHGNFGTTWNIIIIFTS